MRGLCILMMALFLASMCMSRAEAAPPYVQADGARLMLDGQVYKPVGYNQYNLAGSPRYSCGPDSPGDYAGRVSQLRQMKQGGADVVRFAVNQSWTSENGVRNWSSVDEVMRAANEVGVKVFPTLGDHWGACTSGPFPAAGSDKFKDEEWYRSGYAQPAPELKWPSSHRDYVIEFAQRYRDEGAIAMVQVMGEPRASHEALYNFCADLTSLYKAHDPNHLVSCGVVGDDHPGAVGSEYKRICALPANDVCDYHEYSEEIWDDLSLDTRAFAQGSAWEWAAGDILNNASRQWQKVTFTIPLDHPAALQQSGLGLAGSHSGVILVDDITIGPTTYRFGNGTQNWQFEGGTMTHTATQGRGTNKGALKLTKDATLKAWLYRRVNPGEPGQTITAWVWVEATASPLPNNTLAGTIHKANAINKPHIVAETGLRCGAARTATRRANLFDQRLQTYFASGGDMMLFWRWNPRITCK